MQIRLLIIGPVVAALAACASTPDGLRSHENWRRLFEVHENYQLVFKRIVETNRQCSNSPILPIGQAINDAQLYPDLKQGTLVIGASGVGTQIYQTVDISEISPGSTRVVVHAASSTDKITARYKRWADGDTNCSL